MLVPLGWNECVGAVHNKALAPLPSPEVLSGHLLSFIVGLAQEDRCASKKRNPCCWSKPTPPSAGSSSAVAARAGWITVGADCIETAVGLLQGPTAAKSRPRCLPIGTSESGPGEHRRAALQAGRTARHRRCQGRVGHRSSQRDARRRHRFPDQPGRPRASGRSARRQRRPPQAGGRAGSGFRKARARPLARATGRLLARISRPRSPSPPKPPATACRS